MNYPLRYLLSNVLAKMGITITIHINCIYDEQAQVFIATSQDIHGLVLEAENFNSLKEEIKEAIPTLLRLNDKKSFSKISADILFKEHIVYA